MALSIRRNRAITHLVATVALTGFAFLLRSGGGHGPLSALLLDFPVEAAWQLVSSHLPVKLPGPLPLAGMDLLYWGILLLPGLLKSYGEEWINWVGMPVTFHFVLSMGWLVVAICAVS